jgi:hypothetical protein
MKFLVAPTNLTNGAPTVNNGLTQGFLVGTRWFDLTTGLEYICRDNTDGAAVWTSAGSSGGTNLGIVIAASSFILYT